MRLLMVSAVVLLAGCMDDTLQNSGRPGGDVLGTLHDGEGPWGIVVIGTDYASTSVSILDRDSRGLFREHILHSGSGSTGLSIPLSGDVVLPRTYNPDHWIVLLDRYPNSVLTFVDPMDFSVHGQLSVATGFASNPQDFLWLSETKAYVTRLETNPTPGRRPHDGGDDILVVDPSRLEISGRIPLTSQADTPVHPDLQARPTVLVQAEGLVWVTLAHLTSKFNQAGEGRVVAVDPGSDEPVGLVRLPDLANCTGMVYVPSRESLYVSCSGLFLAGVQGQPQRSGIARIDLSEDPPVASVLRRGTDGAARAYGFDIDVAQERWLLVVRHGDLEQKISDVLVALDLDNGEETVIHEARTAYGMGGLLADDATDTVYVGEADPVAPALYRYRVNNGTFDEDGQVVSHPGVGLPPRCIRFY